MDLLEENINFLIQQRRMTEGQLTQIKNFVFDIVHPGEIVIGKGVYRAIGK